MKHATLLYFVRHGESEANARNICGGDYPLTERGRRQAAELSQVLSDVAFDAVYSSDYQRTVETAQIIYGSTVPDDHRLRELRERDFGSLDNTSNENWVAMTVAYETAYRTLRFSERASIGFGANVETDRHLQRRVQPALEQIAQENVSKRVLIVSSAGPMRVMLMELGFADFLTPKSLLNTACIVLQAGDSGLTVKSVTGYVAE